MQRTWNWHQVQKERKPHAKSKQCNKLNEQTNSLSSVPFSPIVNKLKDAAVFMLNSDGDFNESH